MKKTSLITRTGWGWLALAIALGIGLKPAPSVGATDLDPKADAILKSMSTYLGQTKSFTVDADIDLEVVARNGAKLQLSSFATLAVQRPDQFYIQRQGPLSDAAFIFNGKTLTLYSKQRNAYAQINAPGTIDGAIQAFELETGIPAPGADLLFANPYAALTSGVNDSAYLGTVYVNGIKCHHLAFRADQVDWQIWVQTGDRPLPMKYVITSKWKTAAPQYSIRFHNWNTSPQFQANQFTFSAPTGATRVKALPASDLDETSFTGEGQP